LRYGRGRSEFWPHFAHISLHGARQKRRYNGRSLLWDPDERQNHFGPHNDTCEQDGEGPPAHVYGRDCNRVIEIGEGSSG
jgi:hypothetical protein